MGERGNIAFIFAPESGYASGDAKPRRVYFYTHWRGHLIAEILREAGYGDAEIDELLASGVVMQGKSS